jgi:hypothetical protein
VTYASDATALRRSLHLGTLTGMPSGRTSYRAIADFGTVIAPPQAIPTHLESALSVPASGRFAWDVNPSVRAVPPFRADGEVAGPNAFYKESWKVTCTAPDGTVLETSQVTVDRGQVDRLALCRQGTVPAPLSFSLGAPAAFGPFAPAKPVTVRRP